MIDLPTPSPEYWWTVAAVFAAALIAFVGASWPWRRVPKYLTEVSEFELQQFLEAKRQQKQGSALEHISSTARGETGDFDVEQLDFTEAMERRNEVLADVTETNSAWVALALEAVAKLPDGQEGTGEQFRERLVGAGLKLPAHPNAWGALFGILRRRGIMVRTGEYRAMKSDKAHGRETPVLRKQTPVERAA